MATITPTEVPLPDGIDRTFSRDVSDDVNAWIRTLTPNTLVRWPEGRYIVNKTIALLSKSLLFVDCLGAEFHQTTDGTEGPHARTRSLFDVKDCVATRLSNVRAIGANANGAVYVSSLEAQHAVNIIGGYSVEVHHVIADHVYGDIVYVAGKCQIVRVHDIWGSDNGRQGISVCEGSDIIVEAFDLKNIGRSAFDVEPLGGGWGYNTVEHVVIRNGKANNHHGNLLASKGGGIANDIQVYNVESDDLVNAEVVASPAGRRTGYVFVGNKSTKTNHGEPSGAVAKFTGVDGVLCCYNEQPKCQARITSFPKFADCTQTVQSHNVIR
jgi:hypothetical protein